MSETIDQISTEVIKFLDEDRTDVCRFMSRTAVFHAYGSEIEIEQIKYLSNEDAQRIKAEGAEAYMTPEWFNDVDWIQHPGESHTPNKRLSLDATYPMDYFVEEPKVGSFKGVKWLDQYGSISGFGSKDQINLWVLDFVAPDSRIVTRLHYPDDPTAIDQYNARYQQYLQSLTESNPTYGYYRGWDRAFSDEDDKKGVALGGMTLAGLAVNQVLVRGSAESENQTNFTRLLFHYETEQNGYVGRDLIIDQDGTALTEPYWDGEEDRKQASEELLATAVQLLQHTTATK